MLIVLPGELEILREMQPLDRDVFNYLAERVDFETGMIGRSRKVSYGGMAYDLSEHEAERRRRESLRTVTSKQVENSIARLVNAGLLSRLSKSGFNQSLLLVRVFWVAALGKGTCAQKPDGSQLGVLLGALNKLSSNKNNNIESNSQSSQEARREAVGTTSITQQQQQADEKFTMRLDWQPTADEFEVLLFRAGKRMDAVQQEWVAEFVAYWFGEGKRQYSQREWTARLAMRVVDLLRDPGRFERERGGQQAKLPPTSSRSGLPEWARIPRNDDDLTPWAMRHGYGAADVGWNWLQYRGALQCAVEARLKQWRQLS
jgi:hypothetical protein